jgi:hypothetical protein
MRQNALRRFPLIATGMALILISVAATLIGFVRGFNNLQRGEPATGVDSGVALSVHPAFIACGVAGLLLVVAGIVRAARGSGGRPA